MSARPFAGAAEQIRIRPVGDRFAYAPLVCGGWPASGVRIGAHKGGHRIEWPFTGSVGERYPLVGPPPGLRQRLEGQTATACVRATGRPAR